MTESTLERANEIQESLTTIDKLRKIVSCPYPNMISNFKDKKNGFYYNGDVVCFISLDKETRDELKKSIYEILDRRSSELREELNDL